ncbi:MAG: hypothetical protein K1W26_04740 [Acetatifactor sp.]
MAPAKKNVTVNKEEVKPAAKATVKKAPASVAAAKVEEPKAEAVKTEEVKTEELKAEKKPAAKTAEKKTAGKKPAAKAAEKKPAAKKELKSEITVQFGGKSFSQDELVKIAKDVWEYDLHQNAADLTSIELYVKPEENVAYYVMNKEYAGSFYL